MTDSVSVDSLKSKIARQKSEIARMTQKLESAARERSAMARDLDRLRALREADVRDKLILKGELLTAKETIAFLRGEVERLGGT